MIQYILYSIQYYDINKSFYANVNIAIKMLLLPSVQPVFDSFTEYYPHDPVLVYMGVGTANNLSQQWPPFIDALYNKFPSLHVVVILMDPVHENPPLAVQPLRLRYDEPAKKWTKDRLTMQVHTCAIQTHADLMCPETYYNITPELHAIVDYCIQQQFTFLYHDYTGRFNGDLARYMEGRIQPHLDHIIFGWGQRDCDSCTIDLHAPHIMQMPVFLDWTTFRPVLRWFNVYHFVHNPQNLADYWSNTDEATMERQIKHFDNVCLERLMDDILPALRLLRREPAQLQLCHFQRMCGVRAAELNQLLQLGKYDQLALVVYDILVTEFDAVVKFRDWALDGYDFFLKMTHADNPYLWAGAARAIIGTNGI